MIRRLFSLSRPAWGRLALGILAGTAALGSGVGLIATSAWLISRAAQHPPVMYLMVAIVGVRAFGLGRGVFRYAERLVTHDATFRILADLRVRVYRALERLAPTGLPQFRRGDLLGRLVSDVDDVQDLFLRAVVPGLTAVLVCLGAVGLATGVLPAAGAVLFVALAIAGIGAPWVSGRVARRTESRLADTRGALSTSVVDVLEGMPELIAYGADTEALARAADHDRDLTRVAAKSARTAGFGSAVIALACGGAVLGALLVGTSGGLDVVALAVIVLLPLAAFEAVSGLPLAAQYLQRTRRSAERVFELFDAPAPVSEPSDPVAVPDAPISVSIHGLRARWPSSDAFAVDGIDLDLSVGRRIAVVGPSGAGKSTVAAVLLRFLDPAGGSVRINGVPITDCAADEVRTVIGLCAQDAHIFDSTIGENIRLARREATEVEVQDVLDRARLSDWIEELPDGLDTRVGEHGAQVSGGQRQRIALARALLADFDVLVLDEPTANLDPSTADALAADLLDATKGRTTLFITHRLTGLSEVDEIVVLDQGRVLERGTHDDLMAAEGWYRRAYDREVTPRSSSITRAALWPAAPMTLPAGKQPAAPAYTPSIPVR